MSDIIKNLLEFQMKLRCCMNEIDDYPSQIVAITTDTSIALASVNIFEL